MVRKFSAFMVLSGLLLAGCSSHPLDQGRKFSLTEVSHSDLPGWESDKMIEALPALRASCQKPAPDYKDFCAGIKNKGFDSSKELRSYIKSNLTPYAVTSYGDKTGKITGYYEAELKGSRHKIKASQVPIYGNPYGYKYGDTVKTRKKIEADKDFDAPIIAWADDPVDLFILHIQGSGRLITPGGEEIKLGYSGNNGQPFKGIGAIMADEGIPGEYRKSMGAIRKYLKAHPVKARELMAQNPRYIFFKEKPGQSPYGAAGVVLTPYRSIAVDPDFIPMHTPVWLSTSDPDGVPLTRLVMAQDKGTAIKGGIRADFFFGHGETAFDKAGRMHKSGGYYLLLPK